MNYRLSSIPIAIRGDFAVDDRNCTDVAARLGPVIAWRMAARTWDRTITSEAGRQAIWMAVRGPESADDAAASTKVDAAWVRAQLDKRTRYLKSIATRLGLSSRAASQAQHDDLEPVPLLGIRGAEAVTRAVQLGVRQGVAAGLAKPRRRR